jgi:hypothetical protein
MKSTMPKKPSLPNVVKKPEFESELKFEGGVSRQMLSGVKRLTIRLGKRKFLRSVKIHGYDAVVEGYRHTSLLHLDFQTLTQQGFKNMFSTLMILQRFYSGIGVNSEITVVEYRILPY